MSMRTAKTRRGAVILVVLVVTSLAGIMAMTLIMRASATMSASAGTIDGEQARLAALSGVQRAVSIVAVSRTDPLAWRDNPDMFQHQLVSDDGVTQWYFSVYAVEEDGLTMRYGLDDEAGRVSLNTASESALLSLPGMTSELVAALLDYRDADSDAREGGAEQEFYDQLTNPYAIRNGPLTTVEELLLVRGFNGPVLYGEDANCNGLLDPNEDDGEDSFPPDNADGKLDAGLLQYVCTMSYDPGLASDGRPRLNLNTASESALAALGLGAQTAEFIRIYRQEGNVFTHPSQLLEMRYQLKQDQTSSGGGRRRPGVRPRPGQGQSQPTRRAGDWIESGVGGEQLETVLDRLTCQVPADNGAAPAYGLLNVNTASSVALAAVLEQDAEKAQAIVQARSSQDAPATAAWLYTDGLLDADAFKRVAPRLTGASYQFRVRSVGYSMPSGRFCVLEALVDTASAVPKVMYMRDLSRLGMPLVIDSQQESNR